MGMYTQLVMGCEIKPEKYPEIKDVLNYMVYGGDEPKEIPNHPLFMTERWAVMLRCDSFYFDMITHSEIEVSDAFVFLSIVTNLKNYNNEIEHFLNWIMPYLDNPIYEFLGFTRYEEDNDPTLIYRI